MSAIHCRLLGYTVTLVIHTYTFIDIVCRILVTTKDPAVAEFARYQGCFLTIWTFGLQIAYALLGLTVDSLSLMRWKDPELIQRLNTHRETLFATLVWPSSILVPSIFWPLYLYDEALLFPSFIDKVLSPINNHGLHTVIIPIVLWEIMFLPRAAPDHLKNSRIVTVYFISYLIVLFGAFLYRGTFIYPILGKFYGTVYFPMFIIVTICLLVFIYAIQWPLAQCLGRLEEKAKKKSH